MEELFAGFHARVTPQMNAFLSAPVSVGEIRRVAFEIKGGSPLVMTALLVISIRDSGK